MFFQINGFQISPLQKANNDGVISVDIIANHLTEDVDKETVLKEAFTPDTVKEFLDIGVLEYWHESKNPLLSKEDKNKYLIGKPVGFRWQDGKPVVTAHLTKGHPIVQEMLPHLEADQPVYGASIGGAKMVLKAKDSRGETHRIIPHIRWDHLAIAPANAVINREKGLNVRLLRKANDIMLEFEDIQEFKTIGPEIIGKEEELRKALAAPASQSDLYSTPGGVTTKQSLDKKIANLTLDENEALMLIDTIMGIKKHVIPSKKDEYLNYFNKLKKKSFGEKSFRLIDKYFKNKEQCNK